MASRKKRPRRLVTTHAAGWGMMAERRFPGARRKLAVRGNRGPWGVPQFRTKGCMTSGWTASAQLGVNVKRWLRSDAHARQDFEECVALHDEMLGARMEPGVRRSSHQIAGVGRLVIETRCRSRGQLATLFSLKAR